jgi:hypothetical protein
MIYKAVKYGLGRSWQLKRIILLLWLFNMLLGLLIFIPVVAAFKNFFENRPAIEFLSKYDLYIYWVEFFNYSGQTVSGTFKTLIIGNFIYTLIIILFSGGIIHYYISQKKVSLIQFFRLSRLYVVRMLCLAFFGLMLMLSQFVFFVFLIVLIQKVIPRGVSEITHFYSLIIWLIIYTTLLFYLILWIDLTRIQVVQKNSRRIFVSLFEAFQLLSRAPLKFFLTKLIIYVLGFLIILGFLLVRTKLLIVSYLEILIVFLLIQVSVFLQLMIKLSRFGAYVRLTHISSTKTRFFNEDIGIIKHVND